MTNVQFKQGLKANLPTLADEEVLLFATDTGELFKGTGTSIQSYGSVVVGTNKAELDALQPKTQGKFYIAENKVYTFNGTELTLIQAEIPTYDASQISFDNTDTELIATNVQEAINELDDRTRSEDAGKIKLSSTDASLGYLGTKLDPTLAVESNLLVVKGVQGLVPTIAQINTWLDGTTSNIQNQINSIATGINYIGIVTDVNQLPPAVSSKNGDLAVVAKTDNKGNELYIFNGTVGVEAWESIGEFEFSETFIGLTDTPNTYEDGKFAKSTSTGIAFGDIVYANITDAPVKADVQDAIDKRHTHDNKTDVLDKLSVDVDGDLNFDGSKVGLTWGTFQ